MRLRLSVSASVVLLTACGGAIADQRAEDAGPSSATPPGGGDYGGSTSSDGGVAVDASVGAAPLPPAGVSDGVCVPGDVSLGLYDPDCVYVLGSTQPGSAGRGALFHPDFPTRLAAGWGYYGNYLTIRGDRKILFTSIQPRGAYVFAPALPNESLGAQYARHTLLSTPACGSTSPALRDVHLHPKSGAGGPPGYYLCTLAGGRYYELGTSTELNLGGRYLLGIDENGAFLVRPTGGQLIIMDGTVEHPVIGIDASKVTEVRSRRGGGFLVAAVAGAETSPRLYDLPIATGVAVERGAFIMGRFRLTSLTALEPSGALQAIVSLVSPGVDGVVRFRIDAPPEVLFDESKDTTKGAVQLHAGMLVTGP